jgi:hypothetical protein
LLESLLILCQTRIIRERLRVRKVYPILRNLDYLQDNEEVSALIYEVVSQLIGNEDASNPTQPTAVDPPVEAEAERQTEAETEGELAEEDSANPLEDID